MRSRFAALLLLLAALAAVPAAAQVEGRYNAVSINGQPLPTVSPVQRSVTIVRSAYWLEEGGRANVSTTWDTRSGPSTRRMDSRWVTTRDSLHLISESGRDTLARFRWERQGDTLRLYDRHENVYALVREAVVASDPWRRGAWNAVQLNGRNLPAPWPHDHEVMVAEHTMAFGADGRVTVRLRSSRDGRERTHQNNASYRVAGDKLTFHDGAGDVAEEFVWTLRDGRLRLVDLYGHVYVLEPAAATAP